MPNENTRDNQNGQSVRTYHRTFIRYLLLNVPADVLSKASEGAVKSMVGADGKFSSRDRSTLRTMIQDTGLQMPAILDKPARGDSETVQISAPPDDFISGIASRIKRFSASTMAAPELPEEDKQLNYLLDEVQRPTQPFGQPEVGQVTLPNGKVALFITTDSGIYPEDGPCEALRGKMVNVNGVECAANINKSNPHIVRYSSGAPAYRYNNGRFTCFLEQKDRPLYVRVYTNLRGHGDEHVLHLKLEDGEVTPITRDVYYAAKDAAQSMAQATN